MLNTAILRRLDQLSPPQRLCPGALWGHLQCSRQEILAKDKVQYMHRKLHRKSMRRPVACHTALFGEKSVRIEVREVFVNVARVASPEAPPRARVLA